MKTKKNHNLSSQEIQEGELHRHHHLVLGEIVISNVVYFIIAVVLATAFFASNTLTNDWYKIKEANKDYLVKVDKQNDAFLLLEKSIKDNPNYFQYKEAETNKKEAYKVVKQEYAKHQYFGFNSKQQFWDKFGPWLGVFIYSLFNLVMSFIRKNKTIVGQIALHTTILFISLFFLRWCFKRQDFMQFEYILVNMITAVSLIFATYLLVLVKEKGFVHLKNTVYNYSMYIYKYKHDIKPEEQYKHKKLRAKLVRDAHENG